MRAPEDLFDHPALDRARGLELGVSTSAFQSEGDLDLPGRPRTHWHDAQRDGRVEPIGAGVGLWSRWEAAVARCAALRLRRFRFTVEWARLRPDGRALSGEVVRGYARRIISLRRKGIEPIVTLHHFTHPAHLGEDLWLRDDAPEVFAAHADEALTALDDALEALGSPCVDRVLTLNEPNMLALASYIAGVFPHRAPAVADGSPWGLVRAWRCLDAALAGHCLASARIGASRVARGRPPADLSTNVNLLDLHGLGAGIFDLLRAPSLGVPARDLDAWLDARRARWHAQLFAGEPGSPRASLARSLDGLISRVLPLSRLTRTLTSLRDRPAPLTHLAVDLYDPYTAHQLTPGALVDALAAADPDALARAMAQGVGLVEPWAWRPAPEAMGPMVRALGEGMPALPVDVIECGMCAYRPAGQRVASPRGDGVTRAGFLRVMLRAALEARVRDDLPLRAWLYWTLVDNYELGRWSPRFGLWSRDDDGTWGERDAAGEDAARVLGDVAAALINAPVSGQALRRALADGQ